MAHSTTWQDRLAAYFDRRHARRAGRATVTTAFTMPPEPRGIGLVVKGQQLIAGEFLFAGRRFSDPGLSIWDLGANDPATTAELHGCGWLDDLAALGTGPAQIKAQSWVFDWVVRYGAGDGPGWQVPVTAQRLSAWISHSDLLLRGQSKRAVAAFMQSLARQALFLGRRWPRDRDSIATLAGVIHAGVILDGMAGPVDPAVKALAATCQRQIDATGCVPSRNPAALLAILTDLTNSEHILTEAGRTVPAEISETIARIVPVLRGLRHADGGLPRFHGGGRGADGALDAALSISGVKTPATHPMAMGFVRLTAARSSLIVDAAAPPVGRASVDAHASTLGLELTSGRRPLIVNCGSGAQFGDDWRRASRATPSHSTLGLESVSSSHLGQTPDEWLSDVPSLVRAEATADHTGRSLELSHNGYQRSHGLTHARLLHLSADGRGLTGEDLLTTLGPADEAQFDRVFDRTLRAGVGFAIRFHLHPDVTCATTLDHTAVTLWLKSGEIWIFQHDGAAQLAVSPSVYLENGQLKPRAAQQVVLSGSALAYATRVRWSLAKAENTPLAVRDLARADPLDVADQT
ncbi:MULTISPECIES: heparinase II/III family protein [unclassified Yoonia]|uniref:heparinase II/III family protein n=1 Tax=unclassified Yoonia TaxID=2629118 RepID=UPI002AFF32F3|nr:MULTISPECIES: heparinase II/III family protein [unclassified Yoonia]